MRDMRSQTQDTVAALRGTLAELEADQPVLGALQNIAHNCREALESQANVIVAATSVIAVDPGNRYVVGFATDAITAAGRTLSALEAITAALDIVLAPFADRYEAAAHSVSVAT